MKTIVSAFLVLALSLSAQTKFGIMINSHLTNFENYNEASFESNYEVIPFLSSTLLMNFVNDDLTISIRPGYYYSNPVKGFQVGSYFMKNLNENIYANAGINLVFSSNNTKGNSVVTVNHSKTFVFASLGLGYIYKKPLVEFNYEINLRNPVYGTVTYDDLHGTKTREAKINNILKIGFGIAI